MFSMHMPYSRNFEPWVPRNEKPWFPWGAHDIKREASLYCALGKYFSWKMKVTQRKWHSQVDSNLLVSSSHFLTVKGGLLLRGDFQYLKEALWSHLRSGLISVFNLNLFWGEPSPIWLRCVYLCCRAEHSRWLWVMICTSSVNYSWVLRICTPLGGRCATFFNLDTSLDFESPHQSKP